MPTYIQIKIDKNYAKITNKRTKYSTITDVATTKAISTWHRYDLTKDASSPRAGP